MWLKVSPAGDITPCLSSLAAFNMAQFQHWLLHHARRWHQGVAEAQSAALHLTAPLCPALSLLLQMMEGTTFSQDPEVARETTLFVSGAS